MLIFNTVNALQAYISKHKKQRVGFVPTMGALHHGHLSLIEASNNQCEISVCSIFVNPGQFNDTSDLESYPRLIEADIKKLHQANCDVLFYPSNEEVYPEGMNFEVDAKLDHLMSPLEGRFRPGHFEGMSVVVKRLLDIVQPQFLFMGQKDFQQLAIVKSMVKQLKMEVQVVGCPIIREENGLAMSSRNMRLSAEGKRKASIIYKILSEIKENISFDTDLKRLADYAYNKLETNGLQPEYFNIVNSETLEDVKRFGESSNISALTAVWVEDVRLIDNMIIK